MAYTNVYPTRINWEDEPSIDAPINAVNLNKIDYAVYEHDRTFATWDTTKANQSDLLLSVKTIEYDDETGVFVFTWQNGTTKTVDLNIEKIPVSFSMSPQGVITMTTEDGSTYTADVGALIKTYTFADSSVIDFTVVTDADGNKTVTADIVDGSITGQKLQPNYLADCVSAKTDAETAEGLAEDSAGDSEAWANGTRNGVPVPNTDPAYHNNSKYWSEQSNPTSLVGLTDTDINNPTNGQTLIYNSTSQKWENQNGGSASLAGLSDVDLIAPADGQVLTYNLANQEWVNADIGASGGSNITVTTTEATLYGQNVTISDGVTTLTETFSPSGVALFEGVTMTGQLTIASGSYSTPLNVPYFGNYNPVLSGFTATITVTFPADSTCTCTKSGETQTAYVSPHTFYVHSAGTYTITATDGTHTKSDTVTITTDGQSESVTLTYVPDGSTVLPTDDIQIWLNCADIYDKDYTTLAEVLADTTTYSALIADHNAVDYMVRSKSWASNKGLVPTMTSNTTPSGVASADSYYGSGNEAYKAFDRNNTTYWGSAVSGKYSGYLRYQFPSAVCVKKAYVYNGATQINTLKIEASNDGSNFTPISETVTTQGGAEEITLPCSNDTAYAYYQVAFTQASGLGSAIYEVQFYPQSYDGVGITEDSTAMSILGLNNYASDTLLNDADWLEAICNSQYFESVLNVKMPTMTGVTTPSGEVFASFSDYSGREKWKAFDGDNSSIAMSPDRSGTGFIGYKFVENIKIYRADYYLSSASTGPFSATFTIDSADTPSSASWNNHISRAISYGYNESAYTGTDVFIPINANSCWRIYVSNIDYTIFNNVQFYGRTDV